MEAETRGRSSSGFKVGTDKNRDLMSILRGPEGPFGCLGVSVYANFVGTNVYSSKPKMVSV